MGKSNRECYQPACFFAHHLINKLSTIVGSSDLASQQMESSNEPAKHLALIRDTAKDMAGELVEHQCQLSEAVRSKEMQTHVFA
jgi:hypothetical protein